jgi:hypothetical protein
VDHANPESLPLWFPFFFIGLWLVVGALLGALSGWRTLAQRFRATLRPTGTAIKNQVVSIGKIPEHRVTHMVASEAGLYLWVNPLFRFLHPPLMIPWIGITAVREVKTLWWRTFELNIADVTTISVTRRAHELLRRYLRAPASAV